MRRNIKRSIIGRKRREASVYNIELQNFYEKYGEYILIILCKNHNEYFSFKLQKESKLSSHISVCDLPGVIVDVCSHLIKNGKCTIYAKLEKEGGMTGVEFSFEPISGNEINFMFPSGVMNEYERKKIIRYLTKLNSSQIYKDDVQWGKFIFDMKKKADLKIGKLGKDIYIYENGWSDYYNDYYYVYRKINEMIAQRKLVDYVLNVINHNLINIFELDKEDVLLFNGKTIDVLINLQSELENNSRPVISILEELIR